MKRHIPSALRVLILPTLALVAVAIFFRGHIDTAVRTYVLLVCGLALTYAVVALRDGAPAERPLRDEARPRPAGRRPPPGSLGRLEHEAALGVAGSFDLHFRLAPRLRAIAAGLLDHRRKISLEGQPELARAVLGESTWELVRPDRPAPSDRLGRGIPPQELSAAVDSLEAV